MRAEAGDQSPVRSHGTDPPFADPATSSVSNSRRVERAADGPVCDARARLDRDRGAFAYRQENQDPAFCMTLSRYFAGGFPSAFLNIVIKAVTDS